MNTKVDKFIKETKIKIFQKGYLNYSDCYFYAKKNIFEPSSLLMEDNKVVDYLHFQNNNTLFNKDIVYMNHLRNLVSEKEKHYAAINRRSLIASDVRRLLHCVGKR